MKRVYTTSDQVIHLWANQTQSDARCANVFFEGKSIYSYGRHYELGRLHIKGTGLQVAVINSSRYSVTTAKHINQAWQAVEHMVRLKSSDVGDIQKGLLETQDQLMDEVFGVFSQRSFWSEQNYHKSDDYLMARVFEFNKVCDILNKPKMKLEVSHQFIDLMNEHVKKCIERQKELKALSADPEYLAKLEQKRIARAAGKIKSWKLGGPLTSDLSALKPQLIRINKSGDEIFVETTRGARVALDQARAFMKKIISGTIKKGDKIEGFELRGILMRHDKPNAQVVQIGCHEIDLDDAKQVLGA